MSAVRKNTATWQCTGQLQASARCQVESAVTPRASPVHREQVPGTVSTTANFQVRLFDTALPIKWRIMKQLFSRARGHLTERARNQDRDDKEEWETCGSRTDCICSSRVRRRNQLTKHGCRLLWNEKAKAEQFVECSLQRIGAAKWHAFKKRCDCEARNGILLLRCPLLSVTST